MALNADEVAALNERAQQVGAKIGWALAFMPAPNPELVFLVADTPDGAEDSATISIYGPVRVDEVTIHEIDMLLDHIETGQRRIVPDEDGDPRLV